MAAPAVKLWDVATGQERKRLGELGSYSVVAFSPDGEHVAAACGKSVMVWDLTTETYRTTSIKGHEAPISCLAFSPDGAMLATGCFEQRHGAAGLDPSEVRLWELRTGKLRRRFTYILRACDITFSPDGTTLAVCGGDWFENYGSQGKTQLWDVRTGQELASLEAHSRFVTGVAFSPGGKTLATGSYDGSVKLWETNTWQERATLDWDGQQIDHVVFSTDGRTLAASSAEGGVKLWRTPSADEVEQHRWLIWNRRGQQHDRRGQWDESVESYAKAIERKPDNWRCWFDRGDAYDDDEARRWLHKAVDRSKTRLREHDDHTGPTVPWYERAVNQLLRQEAEELILDGVAPYDGSTDTSGGRYLPVKPLNDFDVEDIQGTWELSVGDGVKNREIGTLNWWSLIVTRAVVPQTPEISMDDVAVTEGDFGTVNAVFTVPKKGPRPVSSELTVPSGGISIGSLGLQISLDHGSMTDLTATLTSPSNTTAPLLYDGVQLQWNLVDPNAFDGEPADGVWTLTFTDTVRNRITGTLNNWSLTIAPAPLAGSTANSPELLAVAPSALNFSSHNWGGFR